MAKNSAKKKDFSGYILNCLPSQNKEKDWSLTAAGDAGIFTAAASVPSEKDLRENWWTVPDQGRTGSCVGWGTADGVLRWHFVKAGKLAENEPLSVRYLWMAAKEMDEFSSRPTTFIEQDGTTLKAALDIARKFGMVKDSVLPFINSGSSPELYSSGDANSFYAIASQMKISGYYNLGVDPAQWKSWIANNGPVLTRLNVDAAWERAAETNGELHTYDRMHTYGGHCVVLAGYTDDYFIVRNSWGTGWGESGFAYAYNEYAQEAFTEAYGISL
ncbi:MAG: C1 family peptidase [Treponema sp.]|nr:C1 family peptidase [Treponema sp.]